MFEIVINQKLGKKTRVDTIRTMSTAKCASLLKQEFPSIDDEMKQYIEGVLDSGMDDFESSDDLYEAIGAILHEVSDEKSENDIR